MRTSPKTDYEEDINTRSSSSLKQSILSEAEKRVLIVTSRKCKISALSFKTGSDEKEFVRVDHLNDLDVEKPYQKQARQNINNTREWKRVHDWMGEARLRAESSEKNVFQRKTQLINKSLFAEA